MVKIFSCPGLDSYFDLKDPFDRPNVGFKPAILSCIGERQATVPQKARLSKMLLEALVRTH